MRAYRLHETGQIEKAFEWLKKGAEAGNTSCMIWLGVLYGDGIGSDPHNKKEIFWYKKAWRKNDSSAPNNLAIVYKNQHKYDLAEKWFKIAIESGDGDANLELAKLYLIMRCPAELIKKYLRATINSRYVTGHSIEEAEKILNEYA